MRDGFKRRYSSTVLSVRCGYISGRNELVRAHLWLGDTEAAWNEMRAGKVTAETQLSVAEAREDAYPGDSIQVYRNVMYATAESISNGRYDEPVRLLRKIQNVLQKTGQTAQFQVELYQLRLAFKRKRNFMLEIDQIEREMAQARSEA